MYTDFKKEKTMKLDIILSGVGGQGILSIAAIIGEAALEQGLHIKQAEVHGMSQRGGDVQSNLRISSRPIHSDLIARGAAHAVVSLEPMEALRYVPYLAKDGWIVTNSSAFVNIPNYPDHESVLAELKAMKNVILLDVDAIAKDADAPRAANMALLGAASAILGIAHDSLERAVEKVFSRKGENVVEANKRALQAGLAAAENQINA